jgi:hypothetical protein
MLEEEAGLSINHFKENITVVHKGPLQWHSQPMESILLPAKTRHQGSTTTIKDVTGKDAIFFEQFVHDNKGVWL